MKYSKIKEGIFLNRPNRFIAYVNVEGEEVVCHVKNTGRCKELLIPGKSKVFVEDHGEGTGRKTRYSLIAVEKNGRIINMDSQVPNVIAADWVRENERFKGLTYLKREQKFGNSRFDIYFEYNGKKAFMEVKGVTLEDENVVRFPDAPTERGAKHVRELVDTVKAGYEAYILFVIQMKDVDYFEPNYITDKAFADALKEAAETGVKVMAVDCNVTKDSIEINEEVKVKL